MAITAICNKCSDSCCFILQKMNFKTKVRNKMPDILNNSNEMNGAVWVRPQEKVELDRSCVAIFRLEFELQGDIHCAIINISAADRYRLYINGSSLICGPRKGDRFSRYYETVNIAPHLKKGFNAITVRVTYYPPSAVSWKEWGPLSVWTSELGPMLILSGCVKLNDGILTDLSTGKTSWTASIDKSYELDNSRGWCVIQTEKFYAEEYNGWRKSIALGLPAAVDSSASGIGAHGEVHTLALSPRIIPNMYEKSGEFLRIVEGNSTVRFTNNKAVIAAGETAVLELDAGTLTTAYFKMKTKGKGAKITVTYAERYFPKDNNVPFCEMKRDDWKNGIIYGQSDEIYPCEKETIFESGWFRTFRLVRIGITAKDHPVAIEFPNFIETGYPLHAKAKLSFENADMEKLWEMSLRTLKCCMHETYEDCPYYEQMQYEQDTRLEALFTYAVSGDTRLAQNAIWDFHCSKLPNGLLQSRYPSPEIQVIPGFSLYWIHMLYEYVVQSGDTDCIRGYLPTVDGILNYFDEHINSDGLIQNLGYWEFADWVAQWDLGVPEAIKHGASTLHNLNYSLALQAAAHLASLCKRDGLAEEYIKRSDNINESVIRLCYDHENGLIREGTDFKQFSQHTQVLAVLSEALTGEDAKRAIRLSMSEEDVLKCTFPWHYTVFRAAEKAGLYEEVFANLWGQYSAILQRNLTTMPEGKSYDRSDCHAWSASPLYEYVRMVLGVKPIGIGWEGVEVCPHAVGVLKMSGRVPTPKGDIFVDWRIDGEVMHVIVETPDIPVTVVFGANRFSSDGGRLSVEHKL